MALARLKESIYTYLTTEAGLNITALVGDRIYPWFVPTSAVKPYMSYTQVGANSVYHLTGKTDLANDTLQFDLWADSADEVDQLQNALRIDIDALRDVVDDIDVRRVFLRNITDGVEFPKDASEEADFRVSMDFEFWHYRDPTKA